MMKIRSALFLLMGIFVFIPGSAQDKDRGYWVLTKSRVLYDGDRSVGDNTGIIGGQNGKAQFRILHTTASTFKPDGSFTVNNTEGVTHINLGGKKVPGKRNVHTLLVSWSRPAEYVKVGEENKITIDVQATLDGKEYSPELMASDNDATVKAWDGKEYNAKDLGLGWKEKYTTEVNVSIIPEFTIRNTVFGFEMMKQSLASSSNVDEFMNTLSQTMKYTGADEDEITEILNKAYDNNQYSTDWSSSVTDKFKDRVSCEDNWEQHLQDGIS